ncbi:hypothetical protein D9M68_566480 [compost metagenome]
MTCSITSQALIPREITDRFVRPSEPMELLRRMLEDAGHVCELPTTPTRKIRFHVHPSTAVRAAPLTYSIDIPWLADALLNLPGYDYVTWAGLAMMHTSETRGAAPIAAVLGTLYSMLRYNADERNAKGGGDDE